MVSTRSKSKVSRAIILHEGHVDLEPEDNLEERIEDQSALSDEDDNDLEPSRKRVRSKKHAHAGQTNKNTGRKKYVRGKQGGLKGLMKMPVDIFTEIALHLNPGDLLALAWSSKFFHELLLQRSAIHMWRHAFTNLPALPPCPPNINEPQYAALIFSKVCTLCGMNTMAKLDVYLLARLCNSCRDTELQELNEREDSIIKLELVRYSSDTRPKRDTTEDERRRYTKGAVFAFVQDVEEVQKVQREFRRKRDKQGLAEWEHQQGLAAESRYEHAARLQRYLEHVAESRVEKADQLRDQRQAAIYERLKALGWTQEDLSFKGAEAKPWHALVSAPKPLTDRIWTNILPKLTQMLEENRERHIAEAKKQRQVARRACVDKFLIHMKYEQHPFEIIFQALGVPTPAPPDLSGPPRRWSSMLRATPLKVANPFPKTTTALEWDCLKDIDETEMSLEEVEGKLVERKEEIEKEVLGWRTAVEQQLVERFGTSSDGAENKDVLVINDDANLANQLPRNTRLLLRADTMFQQEEFNPDDELKMPWGVPCYYPRFISRSHDTLDYAEDPRFAWLESETDEKNPAFFARDVKTEKLVKRMLQDLGMPDVSHIELQLIGGRFICGRCTDLGPLSWSSLINHIGEEIRFLVHQTDSTRQLPVRHPIICRALHDLDGPKESEPLVELLTKELAAQLKSASQPSGYSPTCCYLCEATAPSWLRKRPKNLFLHLLDRHDVSEPVEGIHYGNFYSGPSRLKEEWYKKWDEHHDAHNGGTSV